MYGSGNDRSQKEMVKVKLTDNTVIVLNGNITGRMYAFRKINDINWVDKRDAAGMTEIAGLQVIY